MMELLNFLTSKAKKLKSRGGTFPLHNVNGHIYFFAAQVILRIFKITTINIEYENKSCSTI